MWRLCVPLMGHSPDRLVLSLRPNTHTQKVEMCVSSAGLVLAMF